MKVQRKSKIPYINNEEIEAIPVKNKPYKKYVGRGLFLYIMPNGSKLWRLKYYYHKKARIISFGNYLYQDFNAVWEKVLEVKKKLKDGIDPTSTKKRDAALEVMFEAQYREHRIMKFYMAFSDLMRAYEEDLEYEVIIKE